MRVLLHDRDAVAAEGREVLLERVEDQRVPLEGGAAGAALKERVGRVVGEAVEGTFLRGEREMHEGGGGQITRRKTPIETGPRKQNKRMEERKKKKKKEKKKKEKKKEKKEKEEKKEKKKKKILTTYRGSGRT